MGWRIRVTININFGCHDNDLFTVGSCVFLTRECAHAHERVIAIMAFSLGRLVHRLVGWLLRLLTFGHAQ